MRRCKVCCGGLATSRCRIHETQPPALSTSTCKILDAGLTEGAAAFPAPHRPERELAYCANKLGTFQNLYTSADLS
jgi:hypothetical protein